jgi:hypothetical protein
LLGHWKNFDELESNLSLEELMALLDVSRKKDYDDKKFIAAINGVDLEEQSKDNEDIADLKGFAASKDGFGVDQGIAVMQMGEDE